MVKTENVVPFEIPTSSGRTKKYREFGKAYFTLNGAEQGFDGLSKFSFVR